MIEFEVKGVRYKAEKLSAFQQFAVARRLAPLVTALAPGKGKDPVASLAATLADISDENGEFVITQCMTGLQRFNGSSWTAAWNVPTRRAMFEELNDLEGLLPVVWEVIKGNLGNFLPALPTTPDAAPTETPTE